MAFTKKILLLGSGELGREFAIAAKRLGAFVIACDSYEQAPAMQVTDDFEVFPMLDDQSLKLVVEKHRPDLIVPEIEAIRTEVLLKLEEEGFNVVPSAYAAHLTMNRDRIRDLAAQELSIKTTTYGYAESLAEVVKVSKNTGFPCVIKPVMSSSGKGQTKANSAEELPDAWNYAVSNMRGDRKRVIVEQFIEFDYELTLLAVCHSNGVTFCPPIGHRQERGDYQESWQPALMSNEALRTAQDMAQKVVQALKGQGIGWGLFGVEFFVRGSEVIFSELSPRPHDTGMVTLISQDLTEFDLHARAIMGFPIPAKILARPSASAVILADRNCDNFYFEGLEEALENTDSPVDIRIFGKPNTRPYRRMGVSLSAASNIEDARKAAQKAAHSVQIVYRGIDD